MEIDTYDVASMYVDVLSAMRVCGIEEDTRGGTVMAMPEPMVVTVRSPNHRVLMDENRNANPFFHVMEAIWMFAGEDKVEWLLQFNKRYSEYAEADGTVHGAYGNRWRRTYPADQITVAANLLANDEQTRQVVIAMWDPELDLDADVSDRPCNTHIYFRMLDDKLHMTVCNRSNDVVWGMTGANAVHMTMLHELVAHGARRPLGYYHVMTNNAHIYERHWDLMARGLYTVPQRVNCVEPWPLLEPQEPLRDFMHDCEAFIEGQFADLRTTWMSLVALPMYRTYIDGDSPHKIGCPEWRIACTQWLHWNRR